MSKSAKESELLNVKDISILEDSQYFVNRSIAALNLQMRRLKKYDDIKLSDEFWEYVADVNFYIVALRRLRKSIAICLRIIKLNPEIKQALNEFDSETGFTKKMRDIIEHIDAYVPNDPKRHHPDIKNSELYTIHFKEGSFCWAGFEFNQDGTQKAAHNLFLKYQNIAKREFEAYRNRQA